MDLMVIQQALVSDFDIAGCDSREAVVKKLAAQINHLIQADFHRLVAILYRLDISESKLKKTLEENTDREAGELMAELIIERQLQKLKMREIYRSDHDIPDEEKW